MATVPSDLAGYAAQASGLTGLDTNVILAQWISENGWSVPATNNFGNIMVAGTNTLMTYSTPQAGVTAYANFLKDNSNYAGVLATAGQSPQAQLSAIASSPWDAGNYQGGTLLTSVYNSLTGASVSTTPTTSSTTAGSTTVTSDTMVAKIFFIVLGGALLLMGFKVVTDVPIVMGGA